MGKANLQRPQVQQAVEVDQTIDRLGTYETRWANEGGAPPMGSVYRVKREEWNAALDVRIIWELEYVATPIVEEVIDGR